MNVEQKVCGILLELTGKETVSPTDSLQADLALDSLSAVTLLLEIEDGFGIQLDESDMDLSKLNLVEDVITMVSGYVLKCGEENEQAS
jgi:acyl carrier protein